jgi:hypothetical protein
LELTGLTESFGIASSFGVMESKLNELLFIVDEKTFDAFTALLDEPRAHNAGLERLLAVQPPWDEHSDGTYSDR